MVNVKPLGDRVFVRQDEAAELSEGGIVLAGSAKAEKPLVGTVLSIGPEVKHVKVGDRVHFASYAGTPHTIGKTEIVVLREEEILGVEAPEDSAE